jgi:hypothetical protein
MHPFIYIVLDTRSTTTKKYATAWKVTKDIIFDLFVMVIYTILVKYTCLLIYNNQIVNLIMFEVSISSSSSISP